jgi:hypothetical protein
MSGQGARPQLGQKSPDMSKRGEAVAHPSLREGVDRVGDVTEEESIVGGKQHAGIKVQVGSILWLERKKRREI